MTVLAIYRACMIENGFYKNDIYYEHIDLSSCIAEHIGQNKGIESYVDGVLRDCCNAFPTTNSYLGFREHEEFYQFCVSPKSI